MISKIAVPVGHLLLIGLTLCKPVKQFFCEPPDGVGFTILVAAPLLAAIILGIAEGFMPVFGELVFRAFSWWLLPIIGIGILLASDDIREQGVTGLSLSILTILVSIAMVIDRRALHWGMIDALFLVGILSANLLNKWVGGRFADRPQVRENFQGVLISFFSLYFLLLVLEVVFKAFVAVSDGYGFTLAMYNWNRRYWEPINSSGFRDKEWTDEDVDGRVKVLVAGDSLTAGDGIKNVDDRFVNQLGEFLGDHYAVMVVAERGWETPEELEALKTYPYSPDIVILVYYINDIYVAAQQHGTLPSFVQYVDNPRSIIRQSYLINFVYYRGLRLRNKALNDSYLDDLLYYTDPVIWQTHEEELQAVVDWTADQDAELYVVLFPHMMDPDGTRFITDQVEVFFLEQDIPTLNLADEFTDDDPRSLVINGLNHHPNEAAHARVARLIYEQFPWTEEP